MFRLEMGEAGLRHRACRQADRGHPALAGNVLPAAHRSAALTRWSIRWLAELMFVEVVRKYIAALPEGSPSWLSGLRDRHVGQAMRLIHGQPVHQWTLDSLAHEVGLSRSVFADRFTHFVGVSPMHYLGRWRMQLATRHLENPSASLAQVAAEIGYESEAAFNRAFKKHVGAPPGTWRRGRMPLAKH